MACNCIAIFNELPELIEANTEIDPRFVLDRQTGGLRAEVIIQVIKRNTKHRKQPMQILAAYCPFCGRKYIDNNRTADIDEAPTGDAPTAGPAANHPDQGSGAV